MSDILKSENYRNMETATKYKKTQSNAKDYVDPQQLQSYLEKVLADGYVIVPDLLNQEQLELIRQEAGPLLNHPVETFSKANLPNVFIRYWPKHLP